MKIYRMNDRKKVKIKDLTISFSPLSNLDKASMASMDSSNPKEMLQMTTEILRRCIKNVEGIEDQNGEAYQLEIEEGLVSEQCIDELMTLPVNDEIIAVCMQLLANFGAESFIHPISGEKLKGVSLEGKSKEVKKKK